MLLSKDQMLSKLQAEIHTCQLKQQALDDLAAAIVKVRHHVEPSKALIKAVADLGKPWTVSVQKPNAEKFQHGKIQMWGNGLKMNDDIHLLFNSEEWNWAGLFAAIRQWDQSKRLKALRFDYDTIDELIQLEEKIVQTVETMRKMARLQPDGDDRSYFAMRFFPAIYRGLHNDPDR